MIRWLLYRFVPFYFFLVLIIGSALLLGSETGLQLAWQMAQPHLPAELKVGSVHGRIIGKIGVRELRFENAQQRISVEHAWLRWNPLSLLRGKLEIDELVGLRVEVHSSGEATGEKGDKPETLPRLPRISLNKVILRGASFSSGDAAPFVLDELRLRLHVEHDRIRLALDQLDVAQLGVWQGVLEGRLEPERILLEKLEVSDQQALQLTGTGHCGWPALDCKAKLDWKNFRWPLQQARWWSPDGRTEIQQYQGSLRGVLSANAHGEQLPASEIAVRVLQAAPQERLNFAIDWFSDDAGDVRIQGDWQPVQGILNSDWQFKDTNLEPWLAEYPSQLGGNMQLTVNMQDQVQLSLGRLSLNGEVRDQPLQLQGNGRFTSAQRWSVENARLSMGDNHLSFSGSKSDQWKGLLTLKADALGQVHKQVAGRLDGEAQLSGKGKIPQVRAQLLGKQLRWQDIELAQLGLRFHQAHDQLTGNLKLEQLRAGTVELQKMDWQLQGKPENGSSTLQLVETRGRLELEAEHRWKTAKREFDLKLKRGEFTWSGTHWTLLRPAMLRWDHTRQWQAAEQCWGSGDAQHCMQAQGDSQQWNGDARLVNYQLSRLNPLIGEGRELQGRIDLGAQFSQIQPGSPLIDLQLKSSPLELKQSLDGEEYTLLQLKPGKLVGAVRDQIFTGSWNFPTEQAAGLYGEVRVGQDELDGQFGIQLRDIQVVSSLVPEILRAEGHIDGQLKLTGQPQQPLLDGQLTLSKGLLLLDQAETELRNVQLRLKGKQSPSMQLFGHAESGQGHVALDGKLDWQSSSPQLDLNLSGENFLAVNQTALQIELSPQLNFSLKDSKARLRGKLHIPQASIRPKKIQQSSIRRPDPDQVIIGQEEEEESAVHFSSDISLALGEKVNIDAFGLKSGLRGQLRVRSQTGQVPSGSGELMLVDGKYQAYGQNLEIERGRLLFTGGPLSQPGLDLKAFRQARPDIRSGILVRGPLNKPEISLYSDPAMRQTDQLSYLVLGRAAEAQSDSDQAALNNAALALGLKGGDAIANRIKGKLGLDEVSIGAQPGENSSQASLVLGKYLNPDLYVSYGVGLFEPISVFKLRYQIAKNWVLQTESGVESGGDLFYTIER